MVDHPPAAETSRPLDILFVQESPCLRSFKLAVALREKNHKVSMAFTKDRLSRALPGLSDNTFDHNIQLGGFKDLWDILPDYDVVHCHNPPDHYSVLALGAETPIVHDCHDLLSLRSEMDPLLEGTANRGANARVYCSPQQMAEALDLYGADPDFSIVFPNYTLKQWLPLSRPSKLSKQDHEIHLVHIGGISPETETLSLLRDLADREIHIHHYPSSGTDACEEAARRSARLHCHPWITPDKLAAELPRYDFGLILPPDKAQNRRYSDTFLPHCLFEYIAADLPVASAELAAVTEYLRQYQAGFVFRAPEELAAGLRQHKAATPVTPPLFAEDHIDELIGLYLKIIGQPVTRHRRMTRDLAPETGATPKTSPENSSPAATAGAPAGQPAAKPGETLDVTIEIINDGETWNNLVAQSPYALYSHSAEYDRLAFGGQANKVKISIDNEIFLVPLEIRDNYAWSFSNHYGGLIPLTGRYVHIGHAYEALCRALHKNGINALVLSYPDLPEQPFREALAEHLVHGGVDRVTIPGREKASILTLGKTYEEIRDRVYSAGAREKIRQSAGQGVQCRPIDLVEQADEIMDCIAELPDAQRERLPEYYRDGRLFREAMAQWRHIFQENMYGFGAFVDGKPAAYMVAFIKFGEVVVNSALAHPGYMDYNVNHALFDFMIRHFSERNLAKRIMYSFESADAPDRLKQDLGFRGVDIIRWGRRFTRASSDDADTYPVWLKEMNKAKANFLTVSQALNSKGIRSDRPNVVIRHHVDSAPHRAMAMARAEREAGARSTFYLPTTEGWDQPFPRRGFQLLEEEGWEIGFRMSPKEPEQLNRDLEQLQKDFAIATAEPSETAAGPFQISDALSNQLKLIGDGQRFFLHEDGHLSVQPDGIACRGWEGRDTDEWRKIGASNMPELIRSMKTGRIYHYLFRPMLFTRSLRFGGLQADQDLDPAHQLVFRLHQSGVTWKDLDGLVCFRSQDPHLVKVLTDCVKSLEVWEADPQYEADLRSGLPGAVIRINDPVRQLKSATSRFGLILLDRPFKTSQGHLEHFDIIDDALEHLEGRGVLLVNIIPSAAGHDQAGLSGLFNEAHLEERRKFYRTDRPDDIPLPHMFDIYEEICGRHGFAVKGRIAVPRGFFHHLGLVLEKSEPVN